MRRLRCAAAVPVVVAAGLWVRPWGGGVGDVAGGALWTVLVFLLGGIAFPAARPWRLALAAFCTACIVEFGQLVHVGWLDAFRATRVGHLVLGSTFHAPDFAAYALGAAVAWGIGTPLWKVQEPSP